MKMKELKMYEAPKMEVVEIEVEAVLASSGLEMGGGKPKGAKEWRDDEYED